MVRQMVRTALVLGFIGCLSCVLQADAQAVPWSQAVATNMDVTRRSVVFIYAKDAQGKESPDGTGFLLSLPSKTQPDRGYLVLVTARHMADPGWIDCPSGGELIAKMNKKTFDPEKPESGTAEYSLSGQQWIVPNNDSVDLAYTILDGARFEALNVENAGINVSQLPSASESKAVHIGDQVLSAGLLALPTANPGSYQDAVSQKRNYPIFKFGYVSSIPEEKIPVPGCNGTSKLMTEWLIAANLVIGNSGSPIVFDPAPPQGGRLFILGVQSITFGQSDVAGMAPIRYFLDSVRGLNLVDIDLSKPADTEPALGGPKPSGIAPLAQPGPLPPSR